MQAQKQTVELVDAQITLLIPLLARAEETRKPNGLIHDPLALKVIDSLDYDFEKWRNTFGLNMAVFRTRMFDRLVADFLASHPEGVVVEIGAGLNDRFSRLDNGHVRWFDLDFPDVIKMRREYIADSARQTTIDSNVLNTDWIEQVKILDKPVCFVSEASLIYIDNENVEPLIAQLAEAFPSGFLITDTTSTNMVAQQDKHPLMKHLTTSSWFRWGCDDPVKLEKLGLKMIKSLTFFDADKALLKQLPFLMKAIAFIAPMWVRKKNRDYHINMFEFTPSSKT